MMNYEQQCRCFEVVRIAEQPCHGSRRLRARRKKALRELRAMRKQFPTCRIGNWILGVRDLTRRRSEENWRDNARLDLAYAWTKWECLARDYPRTARGRHYVDRAVYIARYGED